MNTLVAVLCAVIGTLCSGANTSPEKNYEATVTSMRRKLITLENKLESLERREMVQKVEDDLTARLEDMNTEFKTRHDEHSARMEEVLAKMEDMHTEFKNRNEELSVKLEELLQRTLEQKEDTDKEHLEMEIKVRDVSKKLQSEKERFSMMDNHLLNELQQVQKKSDEALEKVRSVEDEVKSALEMGRSKEEKLELFQVKGNLKRVLRDAHIASEMHILDDVATSIENLRQQLNQSLLGIAAEQSVFKRKMSNLGNWISRLERENANASHVSKLGESLQDLEKTTKAELQSLWAEVDDIEKKANLHDAETTEIQKTLQNHTSEIDALKNQLFDIQHTCPGSPPSPRHGKTSNFEPRSGSNVRYECDSNFVMTKNSTVHCVSGKWEGNPPICSFLDTTFYAEAAYNDSWYVECYSDSNANKIKLSRAIDTGSGTGFHEKAQFRTFAKSAKMILADVDWPNYYGAYRCGFTTEEGSADIIVPLQGDGSLYFPNPALVTTVEDPISLRLRSSEPSPRILWSHDGRRVPSWDGRKEVLIEKASEEDAGIYHVRYEEDYPRALLRLVVRRCKSNLYGERCDLVCPPCHNGGICHDLLGVCVCPEGFIGEHCEIPCNEGFHGADCARPCAREDCRFRMFCKPNPYGCACARGFKGKWCGEVCDPGLYGADCKQPCHCARGPYSCNRFTGACIGGCAPGWKGESCQIHDA